MRQTLCLFILISFVGGIIAPACDFLWGEKYSVIEICTLNGLETRVVGNDQSPSDDQAPSIDRNCEFCFQNANFAGHIPTAATIEKLGFSALKLRFQSYETALLSRTTSQHSARGPPSLV